LVADHGERLRVVDDDDVMVRERAVPSERLVHPQVVGHLAVGQLDGLSLEGVVEVEFALI